MFTTFVVVAAILASPKCRVFVWSYRDVPVFIEFTDQRYKYMGLGVDHGAGHHSPCDQTSNVQRSAV